MMLSFRAAAVPVVLSVMITSLMVTSGGPARAVNADPGWLPWTGLSGDDASSWVRAFDSSGTTLYAGTEGDGVFRSTNAGVTWAPFSSGLAAPASDIRAIDAGPSTVTIATGGGLFRSNGGGAWQPLGQGAGPNKLNAQVQTIHNSGGTMLVGTVGGVFKSSDDGSTWNPSSAGLPAGVTVWSLDSYPYLPSRILAATSDGAFQSLNGGASWAPLSNGLPSGTNILRVIADPIDPTMWYAITGGKGVYRSTSAGLLWAPANDGLGANLQTRSIALLPVGAAYQVVVGTQNGVVTSDDRGLTWRSLSNDGLAPNTITWALTTIPGVPLALLAGTQGGGVHYRIMVPPTNTAAPTLSTSSPVAGKSVSVNKGSWTGTQEIRYSYQWQRCSSTLVSSCANIAGETATTYTPVASDATYRLRAVEKAENAASPPGYPATDAGNEPTSISGAVAPNPGTLPGATIKNNPTITPSFGTISVGDTLTATPNSWSPAATSFAYRWYRCNTSGASCEAVSGFGSGLWKLGVADAGHRMGVVTAGTNASGTAYSDMTVMASMVLPQQVSATTSPKVSGQPWIGQTLVRATGSYSGVFENAFTTWQVCDTAAGAGCTTIAGSGNTASFVLNNGQSGRYVRVRMEIDVNGFNETPASLVTYSDAVGPVIAAPAQVANTSAPSIVGSPYVGAALTVNPGIWTGAPAFSYQWLRCDPAGANCAPVAGATGATHVLSSADSGSRIAARVTGVNGWGIAVLAQSAATAPIGAAPVVPPVVPQPTPPAPTAPTPTPTVREQRSFKPTYKSGATIVGKARVRRKLSVRKGTWVTSPGTSFSFRWTRNGKPIKKATRVAYTVTKKDRGKRLGVIITARNPAGVAKIVLKPRTIKR